jgi:hypothetical protein
MRRSTVLSLSLQLAFPGCSNLDESTIFTRLGMTGRLNDTFYSRNLRVFLM